uniref:Uncharacterized protein n=1 Tax=Romanomermis culicivorax TaxID=13658 RepID=A0A915KF66_ROMCU
MQLIALHFLHKRDENVAVLTEQSSFVRMLSSYTEIFFLKLTVQKGEQIETKISAYDAEQHCFCPLEQRNVPFRYVNKEKITYPDLFTKGMG